MKMGKRRRRRGRRSDRIRCVNAKRSTLYVRPGERERWRRAASLGDTTHRPHLGFCSPLIPRHVHTKSFSGRHHEHSAAQRSNRLLPSALSVPCRNLRRQILIPAQSWPVFALYPTHRDSSLPANAAHGRTFPVLAASRRSLSAPRSFVLFVFRHPYDPSCTAAIISRRAHKSMP